MKGGAAIPPSTMPSSASPESIVEYTCNRDIKIDANIIAYFGDYFNALRKGLSVTPETKQEFNVTPAMNAHTVQSNTASAQNPS
jgi:hypothetical protein